MTLCELIFQDSAVELFVPLSDYFPLKNIISCYTLFSLIFCLKLSFVLGLASPFS